MYATDLPYEEAMDQLTQKHLDTVKLIKQSEFEKPYLEDDYVAMEYAYNYPGAPEFPSGPGGIAPDCNPKNLGAWGALGSEWELCKEPDPQATVYLFECCHKIISFSTSDPGLTLTVDYIEGDKCVVTITGVRGKSEFILNLETDKEKLAELIRRVCCPTNEACDHKCEGCAAPTIGYTSQQMSCGGTQTLTHSGGGAGGLYTWSTNYGTFSAPTGTSVVYTAPAANGNCANNPTITLTDCCGHVGTLKLAVNCYTPIENAGIEVALEMRATPCSGFIKARYFRCSGAVLGYLTCCSCDCNNATCDCNLGSPPPDYCTEENIPIRCAIYCGTDGPGQPCNSLGGSCTPRMVDIRTDAQKAGACCPQQLL